MKKISFALILSQIVFAFTVNSCNQKSEPKIPKDEQLNISVLLDLSDRITPQVAPNQVERDKEIITTVLKVIKNKIRLRGTFTSEDRMNFIFYPQPNSSNIEEMASVLNFDLAKISPPDRKMLYKNIDSIYKLNIDNLYKIALNSKSFDGCDIWRFFKDEVNEKCIINKPNYKNFLILLTDGYIYWKNSMMNKDNRFSYLLPTSSQITKFRNNNNWEEEFEKGDYGLIDVNKNLSNLNVLVLELNPPTEHPEDFDILKKYIGKWFIEMGIGKDNFKILKSDLPVYTKPIIESFISK